MTTIHCKKRECLNNRHGQCIAVTVTISKKCDDYITALGAKVTKHAVLHRTNGRLKNRSGKTLK